MNYPIYRPRRLRRNERFRNLIRETTLQPKNFIYPLFIGPGKDRTEPVSSMPGIAQLSVDHAVREAQEVTSRNIPGVFLFGIQRKKDALGSEANAGVGVGQRAIRSKKKRF